MSINPVGLQGIDFIEFASPEPDRLDRLFRAFGFSRTLHHPERRIDLYEQGDIRLLLNRSSTSFAASFSALHGPSICSMGWRVHDSGKAREAAVARGARARGEGDLFFRDGRPMAVVYGIGESLIYLVDHATDPGKWERLGFVTHPEPVQVPSKGFTRLDHLTNNVEKGGMGRWSAFYKDVFGFTEVRYFDIRGVKTGLTSYALRSPCGTFCIPINEADEKKSQINEYLEEYKGPGVQHLAFLTNDILESLRMLDGTGIEMLDMDADYYREAFQRVPQVTEDREEIRRRNVLVDGDEEGYLLQIFTRNLIGPIFIEIIQRKNHLSFGEGNFSALFRSIERDQARRGVFDEPRR
jgi:4-hydroxyphenylpyruvate dioxygenase